MGNLSFVFQKVALAQIWVSEHSLKSAGAFSCTGTWEPTQKANIEWGKYEFSIRRIGIACRSSRMIPMAPRWTSAKNNPLQQIEVPTCIFPNILLSRQPAVIKLPTLYYKCQWREWVSPATPIQLGYLGIHLLLSFYPFCFSLGRTWCQESFRPNLDFFWSLFGGLHFCKSSLSYMNAFLGLHWPSFCLAVTKEAWAVWLAPPVPHLRGLILSYQLCSKWGNSWVPWSKILVLKTPWRHFCSCTNV